MRNQNIYAYTQLGKVVNIDTCSDVPKELFEIDGDMNPMGK